MKRKILILLLACFMFIGFQGSLSFAAGPANIYKITIKRFELFNGTSWVEIFTGASTTVDIAAANSGSIAGTFLTANNIPDGTYTRSRTTVDNSITVKGNDGEGTTRYTTAATASGGGNTVCVGTTVAANEAECTVVLATAPVETHTFTAPLTISGGTPSHKIRVNFDVSGGLETAGGGNIVTAAPVVTVEVIPL